MNEKHNRATDNRPEGDRSIDAPLLLMDIPKYIQQVKEEEAWRVNDRNAITLFKTNNIRLLLIALHAGAEMHTERPENVLILQVLEGRLQLRTNAALININKEQALALHEQIVYSITAIEEAVLLLTVSNL